MNAHADRPVLNNTDRPWLTTWEELAWEDFTFQNPGFFSEVMAWENWEAEQEQ